jgi:hypothetical protein
MFYEFLSDFPIHQQGMYFALGLLSFSLILTGWILFSCRMQEQEPERDQEDFHDEASIAKQLEESQRIEQEARDFYSKPSTVRYQLSGMERLRILRGQNRNSDEDSEDIPIGSLQDQEDSSEDEANAIWNQAVISSITFRKSPEQES